MSQPVGPAVDSTPAQRPGPVEIGGRYCRIEPLDPLRHGEDLWREFSGNETLWTYFANGPFINERSFAEWLDQRASLVDPFSYAVVDLGSGRASGNVALLEIRPAMRVIEIGSIVYGPALQQTRAATEAQYLMACYAFETLGYRRYEWKCDALNARSRQAALRLGFTFEGIFRQHRIVKGRNRDTAWYAMLDDEWPMRKQAFERWLAPENFDGVGRQLLSLSAINGADRG
jgi:RimJ/RimL family protein N-acetyltransferase